MMDFFKPKNKRLMLAGFILSIFVQVFVVNAIVDFAPKIFITAGFKIDAALFATFRMGITTVVFTFVPFYFIDKPGRRTLYVIGSSGMLIALLF